MIGETFGRWKVLEYEGNGYYKCECQCENHTIKSIKGYTLIKSLSKSCGCLRKELNSKSKLTDLTGKQFGEWTVLEYAGESMWKCKCSCGVIKNIKSSTLRSGASKSCGHNTTGHKDLSEQKINHWNILEYVGNGEYKCQCDCENKTIKIIKRSNLVSGASKSCGCGHKGVKIIDLTGMTFGKLHVEKYIGNQFWECKCTECGNISYHNGEHLRRNSNFSCERCDLKHLSEKEVISKINEYIKENNRKPYRYEVAELLDIGQTTVTRYINNYNIENLIDRKYKSRIELEVSNKISCNFILNDRKALGNGQEIDIFIPDKGIGIEVNGGYWHSEEYKDKYYHQNKTVLAEQRGIKLVHIFDYEWTDQNMHEKLEKYIDNLVDSNKAMVVYARKCCIQCINSDIASNFLTKYHLQGAVQSEINLGLFYKSNLIAVMTFGQSRFDTNYQYEIFRLAYVDNIRVLGGTEKLFKYFISKYKPISVVSYCDITKFSGSVYEKIGMKLESITEPGYVWWNLKYGDKSSVLTRYQTQKNKLLSHGLGELGSTENEIMEALGYTKIYNCGNKKYVWHS